MIGNYRVDMQRIVDRLEEIDMSQEQMCVILGICYNTWRSRISGKTPFRAEELLQLKDTLGLSLDDIYVYRD